MTNTADSDQILKMAWNEMVKKKFKHKELEKTEIMNAIKLDSHSTIVELKKGLKQKLTWILIFMILFLIASVRDVFRAESNQDFIFYVGFITIYVLGFLFTYIKYSKMNTDINQDSSILSNLKINRAAIKSALRIERLWGIIGMLFVALFTINKWVVESTAHPKALAVKIIIFLLIIVVLGFIAEWMNKKKFSARIKNLDENIIRLETLS